MSESSSTRPRVVAVGGGKGGTGKSLLAANIGIFLATIGNRVVLVDAALGGASLHTFIGSGVPRRSLSEVLAQASGVHLNDLSEKTPVPGLELISGQRDPLWAANPRSGQIKRLVEQIREVDADYVVIDLGPGTGVSSLDLFLMADIGVLVVLPEPTAIELGYRFLRAAFIRRLKKAGLGEACKVPALRLQDSASGMPAPLELYQYALENPGDHGEKLALAIEEQLRSFQPRLVVNSARTKAEMDLGHAVVAAGRRRLGTPLIYLGPVEYDEAVWVTLRRNRPLLIEHPESRVAKCIEKVTRRLMAHDGDRPRDARLGADESFYELFDVAPTAGFEEIRRANRHVREVFGHDSVVVAGLYTREGLDLLHRRFEEAYSVLMDAAKRKAYDQRLFPEGLPQNFILGASAVASNDVLPGERPPRPSLDDGTTITGPLLKQVRESQGIELRDVSERSKIGMSYLRAIEGEIWEKLPADVYVRGFLRQYAVIIGVSSERVVDEFLARYREARRAAQPD